VTVHLFVGPTLPAGEVAARLPGAIVHGPAAFGDVYRVARARPLAIGIVDGYFDHVLATWHKEILWAMSEGVHVFGASSMGALRAAELADFGMEGVGEIFESFRSGALEDDDEVAVVHGAAADGYELLSEAMVNIRATLRHAGECGILGRETAAQLIRRAKLRFYPERSYAALLQDGAAAGLPAGELESLRRWLPEGTRDAKRDDALRLLERLATWLETQPGAKHVAYHFETTDAWHQATRFALAAETPTPSASAPDPGVLEELKLRGAYRHVHDAALARSMAVDRARDLGMRPDPRALRRSIELFRHERGDMSTDKLKRWQKEQRLDDAGFDRFFRDQARVSWSQPHIEDMAQAQIADHLRASGTYGDLLAKAETKRKALARLALPSPSLDDAGVSESELWEWYFKDQLQETAVPDADVALHTFARGAGFEGIDDLRAAVLREFCFSRMPGTSPEGAP
jgi:hypothetical protein